MSCLPFLVVMLDIIARLPPKNVAQCKLVCKEWLDFILDRKFVRAHCHYMRASADQKLLMVGWKTFEVHSLNYKSPGFIVPRGVARPFYAHPSRMFFLASLDGMLCVCLQNTCELVVWNPLTTKFKKLANSNSQGFYKVDRDALGFFVDSSDDYNILHIKRRRGTMTVYIYSMDLNSWSTVRFLKHRPYHHYTYLWSPATLCGGGLYFVVTQCRGRSDGLSVIRFDVNSKSFSELCFPNVYDDEVSGSLVNINEELHMYVCIGNYDYRREIVLWRLKNKSWMKVFAYPDKLWMPLSTMCSFTYYNLPGTCLVITNFGQVIEIDLQRDHLGYFCRMFFYRQMHGAVYTETIASPNY
ncbi:putative F-box domain, galactose oxidase/kelch, beta-propeller, F-box associated interaction [Helianthus annuus]|nr:putative F-box domain, galactose oxidase/kelch, beta-propeller, F-box associated interaction [Helianthus annuus]